MYKKILVAIDESKYSKYALSEAIKLSKFHKASLIVIHIENEYYDPQIGPFILPEEYENYLKKRGQRILSNAEKLAKKSKVKIKTKLIEVRSVKERIAEIIVDEADHSRVNLIVLGTHGRRGLHRIFMGSVAEGVVRISSIPVLLIRSKK